MRPIALLPVLALAGCLGVGGNNITEVGNDVAPTQTVRVAGVSQPVQLGGTMETGRRTVVGGTMPRHEVAITLNGQQAIREVVNTYSDTNISGSWNGMPVAAACRHTETAKASRRFDCAVTVRDQNVGTVTFNAYARGARPQQTAAAN